MKPDTFEDQVRLAIHDIIVHLHKTWDAFSEAARQMNLTPEQAEASLLAKAVTEIRENPDTDEEKFRSYLTTSFVLSCIGLLPEVLETKLNTLAPARVGNWKDAAAEDMGVTAEFIKNVHAACVGMGPEAAAHFILRGLRVTPSTDALVHAAKAGGQAPDERPRRRKRTQE